MRSRSKISDLFKKYLLSPPRDIWRVTTLLQNRRKELSRVLEMQTGACHADPRALLRSGKNEIFHFATAEILRVTLAKSHRMASTTFDLPNRSARQWRRSPTEIPRPFYWQRI